jgi:small subunit ribosomal protein S13
MAKEQKSKETIQEKQSKPEKQKKPEKEESYESLVRIMSYDIPGSKNIYTGLTKIKGVSWAISNAACFALKFPQTKKISELTREEISKIEEFLKNPQIRDFLKNRRFDLKSGETSHVIGSNLDMRKDFDIRRLKKIRSYKGVRHTLGQPVRGQKTRSHFKSKGKAVGVTKKKVGKKG